MKNEKDVYYQGMVVCGSGLCLEVFANKGESYVNSIEVRYPGGEGETFFFELDPEEAKKLARELGEAASSVPRTTKAFQEWVFECVRCGGRTFIGKVYTRGVATCTHCGLRNEVEQ